MALSNPRYKILPLRGTFASLGAEVENISEGEICYATDQDQYYQKEGGVLVAVGATKAQGLLADSAVQPGDNVSELVNDAGYITSEAVTSVAGKTGDVTLVAADITDLTISTSDDANTVVERNNNANVECNSVTTTKSSQNSVSGELVFRPGTGQAFTYSSNRSNIRAWLLASSGTDAVGSYALLKKTNSGSAGAGSTVNGSNLRYASAAGNSQGTPSGTWKAMGRSLDDGNQTGEKLTTVWLKIA